MKCVETYFLPQLIYKTIDFLKNEIEEKNFTIKTLMFSNAKGGGKVDKFFLLILEQRK